MKLLGDFTFKGLGCVKLLGDFTAAGDDACRAAACRVVAVAAAAAAAEGPGAPIS